VGVTVLWTAPDGVRCVVTRYDETRYQLRLLRDGGTIKADLFSDHAEAVTASREWSLRWCDHFCNLNDNAVSGSVRFFTASADELGHDHCAKAESEWLLSAGLWWLPA
jgi:hypothetical protein